MPYDRASANRALYYAAAASILLHALLLAFDWPRVRHAIQRPVELLGPIVARLVEPPAPPVEKPAPPIPEKKIAPAPSPVQKPVLPKPAPRVTPAPAPSVPKEPPVAKVPEPPSAAPAPAPPAAAPAPPTVAVPAPAPAAPAISAEALVARYRAALLDEARRYKRYPPVARDNGWEGEVVVRMVIGADGSLAALSVLSSSGHAALDRQALDMFRRAKPGVPVPQALRGRQFTVELRAVFSLEDQVSG